MPIETLLSLAAEQNVYPKPHASAFSQDSAHLGASRGAKELVSWSPAPYSADAALLPELGTLRDRSRDLIRNNGVAAGSIQTQVDNVIGTGPRLCATPDYRALGKTGPEGKAWAEAWSNDTEAKFRSWAETTECDAAAQLNLAALTTQVFRGGLANGEALALPLWIERDRSIWKTRLMLVESDRLSNPNLARDTMTQRGGIELDEYGRPLFYNIRTTHPGDIFWMFSGIQWKWDRIPAETDWGRKRVLHIHDKERSGQTRGKPLLSAVLAQFKMLDHYQRVSLQTAVAGTMIAAFMETPLGSEQVAELMGADISDDKFKSFLQYQNQYTAPIRSAAVIPLPPGSQMREFKPSQPTDMFDPFVSAIARQIGAGIGMPYELVMKDFSKSNYSSARAALLEAWRFFNGRRKWMEDLWLGPVYALWLEEAVNAGIVDAPGFYENHYAYARCRWVWPGRGWVDPVKEIEAAKLRIETGISTLEKECAEQGDDWEEIMEQRASEAAKRKELGLPDNNVPLSRRQPAQEPVAA